MGTRGKIKSGSPGRYIASLAIGSILVLIGGGTVFAINYLQIAVIRKTHFSGFVDILFTALPLVVSVISIIVAGFVAGKISRRNGFIVGILVGSPPALLVIIGYSLVFLLPQNFAGFHYRSIDILSRAHLPTGLRFVIPYILAAGFAGWVGERLRWENGLKFQMRTQPDDGQLFQEF